MGEEMERLISANLEIADHYGLDPQMSQTQEECAELIQAISKYKRAKGIGQSTPISVDEAKRNLVEEIIDVKIMIEQLQYLLDVDEQTLLEVRHEKLMRTQRRIQEES